MALTRISSAGIQTSPTFSGDVKIGLGATLESTGNAYVTGITTLGIGATGDVYLYNPSNSALSGTENSAYGWKAKTFCQGLQVNSKLYLSRSGSNGLSLNYNNATGSYITANSGFMNISVPHGPPMRLYASCIELHHNHGTKQSAFFHANGAVQLNHGGNKKFETTSTGAIITGIATVTGSLSVGGTVTYEDVTNVDSIGIVTAQSGIHVDDSIVHIGDLDTKIRFPDSNEISFETGGVQRLKIHSDGKFSFGHDNPSAYYDFEGPATSGKLHLADFVNVGQNTLQLNMYGGSTDLVQLAAINAEQNISIVTENVGSVSATTSKGIYIKSGGNVGVNNVNPAFKLDVAGTFNVTGGATISGVTTTTSFGLTTEDLFATGITTANQAFRVNGNSGGTGVMPFVVRHGGYQGIQTSLFTTTLNNYPELVLQNEWGGNWNTTGPWKLKWTSPNEGDAGPAGDGRVLAELMPAIGNAGNNTGFRLRATDGSTGLKNVFLFHPQNSRFYINNSSGTTEALAINAVGIGITQYIYHAGNNPTDINTRFGFSGNDTIDFETNGTQRLLINNSGASVTGAITGTVSSANTEMLTLTANMGTYNNRSLIIKSPVTDSSHNPFSFQTSNAFEFKVDAVRTLFIHESGRIDLHHNGSTDAKLSTSSTGINISGDLTIPDSIIHSGDTDTKIRFPSNDTFAVETAATERLRITSTGRVGIGTTNPIAQLDVNVGSSVTAFNIEGSEGQLFSVTNNLSSGSIFAVNDITGLPSVDVNADGTIQLAPRGTGELVGIGTTSPTSKLHVVGDTLVTGVSTHSNHIDLPDDALLRLGVKATNPGGELTIEHHSSNVNFIKSPSNRTLQILGNGGVLMRGGGNENIAYFLQSSVKLYQNQGLRLETTSNGVDITGGLAVSGVSTFSDDVNLPDDKKLQIGNNQDIEIYHTSNESFIRNKHEGNYFNFQSGVGASGGFIFKNEDNDETYAILKKLGVELYHNDTKRLDTTSTGVDVTGGLAVSGISTFADNVSVTGQLTAGQLASPTKIQAGNPTLRLIQQNNSLSNRGYIQFYYNTSNLSARISGKARNSANGQLHFDVEKDNTLTNILLVDDAGIDITGNITATGTIDGTGAVGSKLFQQDALKNMIAGTTAGLAITVGTSPAPQSNILIGCNAGARINTSCLTVAIGVNAGQCITGGSGQHTFIGSVSGSKAGCCGHTPNGNTFLGFQSGKCGYNPIYNTYLGYNAGLGNNDSTGGSGGSCNVAIGFNAAGGIRSGHNNVLVGRYTGFSNSTGTDNMGFGNHALACSLTGSSNFAGGYYTLLQNVTGSSNVAIGRAAMRCNVSGSQNVGIGFCALGMNTCGANNIALGECAMRCHDTNGGSNFAAGYSALRENEGSHNFAAGSTASFCNTTGCHNISIGHNSGRCNTTGCYNISLGMLAGSCNETASDSISIGQYANYCNKAGANIAIGRKTSFHDDVATNGFNVAIGDCAFMGGTNMGTRKHNVAIGIQAGGGSTAGLGNVFIGCYSGYCNGGGSANVYINRKAGYFNKTGHDNVMIGDCAGFCGGNQNCNVFIGKYAGYCNSSNSNIAIGLKAGCCITSGGCNIAIGQQAGLKLHAGSDNIAIGRGIAVFSNVTGSDNILMGTLVARRITSGAYNTFIGGSAGRYVTTASNNIGVGAQSSYCLSTGGNNVGLGACSNRCLTVGLDNIAIGRCSGYINTTKSGNVAVGHSAGYGIRGANNISIGATSGPADSCTDTHDNIFIGRNTGTAYTSACCNIAIGVNAGPTAADAFGCNNIHIGHNTGCKTQSGDNNITIGCRAGRNLTTGKCSIFIGLYAGGTISDTSSVLAIGNRAAMNACGGVLAIGCCAAGQFGGGPGNGIFIGRCAGRYANSSSSPNIVIGGNSGRSLTLGLNVIIGSSGAYYATSACRNIGFGGQVLQQLTTGDCNIALGTFALAGNTTGCNNVALGDKSGAMNTGASGSCNVTIAVGTGNSLTTGSDNIFVGRDAGYEVKSSSRNVIIGCGAGRCLRDGGGSNTFIGDQAGHYMGRCDCSTNTGNTFIGQGAGKSIVNSCHAIAIGYQAAHGIANCKLFASHTINIGCRAGCKMEGGNSIINIGRMAGASNSGGSFNVNIGYQAGYNNLTGGNNFYGGYLAGFCNKTGGSNIAIGQNAFKCGTSGTTNIFMLNATGCNANGHSNIALGYIAFRCNSSGSHNIALGACAMRGCDTPANGTGCCNIFLGKSTGCYISAGNKNTVIGVQAGYAITTGSCNVILGIDAGQNITSNTHNVVIGPFANVPSGCSGTMTIGCCTMNWITGFSDGSVTINNGNANANGLLRISKNGNGAAELRFDTASANTASVYLGDDEQLRVRYGSTEHTRFTSSGSVGIGTASPRTKLHVEGSVHASRFFQNPTALDTTVTFPESGTAVNGGVYGPYTINSGVTLTISDGSTFTVV